MVAVWIIFWPRVNPWSVIVIVLVEEVIPDAVNDLASKVSFLL